MPGVEQLHQVGVDALERTPAPDEALNDLWRPGVAGDSVEVEPHTVEDSYRQSVREAPPTPQADVDASTLESATGTRLLAVFLAHEPYQIRLRLMNGDG